MINTTEKFIREYHSVVHGDDKMGKLKVVTTFRCGKCGHIFSAICDPYQSYIGYTIACPRCGSIVMKPNRHEHTAEYGVSTPIHDSTDLEPYIEYEHVLTNGSKILKVDYC